MKLIIAFTLLLIGSCSSKNPPAPEVPVTIKEDEYLTNTAKYRTSYSLTRQECIVTWIASGSKTESTFDLDLRYGMNSKCSSFHEQLPLHTELLKRIFKDKVNLKLKTLLTGPLSSMEPGFDWNIPVAIAASTNPEWEDYTKNYPKHKNNRSINELFVDLANQTNAYPGLSDLFKAFGKKIELLSVEKVFAQRMKDLPFQERLKNQGVTFSRSLMYDAGMLAFKVNDL